MTYEEAKVELERSRSRPPHRRLPGRNTTLVWGDGDSIRLRYVYTAVVTWYANGNVMLDSGGFRTVTTKERMNRCTAVNVYQQDFSWYVRSLIGTRNIYPFTDRMVIGARGELLSCGRASG